MTSWSVAARDWLPSWSVSLALHTLAMLIAAFVVYQSRPGAPPGVIVSRIGAADGVGTTLDTSQINGESASAFNPAPAPEAPDRFSELGRGEGSTLSNSLSFDPGIPLPKPTAKGSGPPSGRGGSARTKLEAGGGSSSKGQASRTPFSARNGNGKGGMLRRGGGSQESEIAVANGVDWLARHQRVDGAWELNSRYQCTIKPGCRGGGEDRGTTAATGLALLAIMGAGHSHVQEGLYQHTVQMGLAWLIQNQSKDGDYFDGATPHTRMYNHAIATMAVCEALALTGDQGLQESARRAVGFIVRSQSKAGGWRYAPGDFGDTSVFGWNVLALRIARLAKIEVPKETYARCSAFLDKVAVNPEKTSYAYGVGGPGTATMTVEALLCRQYLGWSRDRPEMLSASEAVEAQGKLSEDRNIYYWYYGSQFLHNHAGKSWESWNRRIRNYLCSTQITQEGCSHGSWDPALPKPDVFGASAGRLYQTALSVLTLEVYYRYLPLYDGEKRSEPPLDGESTPKK